MASPTVPKFPFMVPEGKRWSARMDVPAALREQLGKRVFKFSTGETDPFKAYSKARPIIEGWQRTIRAAKSGRDASAEGLILDARRAFLAAKQGDGPDAWESVVHPLLVQLKAMPADSTYDDETEREHREYEGPSPTLNPKAAAIIDQITGEKTPVGALRTAWEASLESREDRQRDQYKSDFGQFMAFLGAGHSLEDVDGLAERTQEWADKLMAGGLSAKTVARKLSVLQNYWHYLVSRKLVSARTDSPFRGRTLPSRKRQDPSKKRQHFKPSDIAALYRAALTGKDIPLADLIHIGAYTGARIEEIAGLEVGDVDLAAKTVLMSSKTDAGHRTVPILPQIEPVLERLIANAQAGKFLFHVSGKNKYQERSAAIGKRFGHLKTDAGFDGRFVFHSIRKTVTTLFENVECPEGVAADIVGHEKPTMTYGLYSGGSSMEQRRVWMEKALVYPGL
jgi:integrase